MFVFMWFLEHLWALMFHMCAVGRGGGRMVGGRAGITRKEEGGAVQKPVWTVFMSKARGHRNHTDLLAGHAGKGNLVNG